MRIISIVVIACAGGCIEDQSATLFDGTYPGESSYAATIEGNGDGLSGAAPMTVVSHGDSTMTLGESCVLSFDDIALATDSRGRGTSATAMLAGTGCEVPVDGGSATFDVTSGSATSTGGTSLVLSVGGNLVSWLGTPSAGYVTVMFQGAWTHD